MNDDDDHRRAALERAWDQVERGEGAKQPKKRQVVTLLEYEMVKSERDEAQWHARRETRKVATLEALLSKEAAMDPLKSAASAAQPDGTSLPKPRGRPKVSLLTPVIWR